MLKSYRPRVAFVSHSPSLGGAERVLANILKDFPSETIEPVVVFPTPNGPLVDLIAPHCKRVLFPFSYGPYIPSLQNPTWETQARTTSLQFEALFRELELDGIVVNTTALSPVVIAAAKCGIPTVLHSHGIISPALFDGLDVSAWAHADSLQCFLADRIIAPSNWVSSHYRSSKGLSEQDIVLIPNGTEIPDIERTQYPRTPHFVMLCTLEPNKGVQHFIDAAALVLERFPNGATFEVFGDGAPWFVEKLWERITAKQIRHRFTIRPKQKNVTSIYSQCTATVVASYIESFSCVAVEAMSYARPVIATRCGGPDEIVKDQQTGYLVPTGSSVSIANAMIQLIENPKLIRILGDRARSRVIEHYDVNTIRKHYLECILDTIDNCRNQDRSFRKYNSVRNQVWKTRTNSALHESSIQSPFSPSLISPRRVLTPQQKVNRAIRKAVRQTKDLFGKLVK